MPKLKLLLLFLSLVQFIQISSQTNIDSLINLSNSSLEDSVVNKALLDLCWALKASKPEIAIAYGERALEMSRKNKKLNFEATALKNIGTVHLFQGNYDQSENYYNAAIKIFLNLSDQKGASGCYNNLGLVMELKGDFEIAMDYYNQSLEIDKKTDNKNGIAASLTNIGNILQKKGNYKNSIEYYIKSLKIREEMGDKTGIADAYNNIGALYEKQDAYDEAIKNYQNALVLYIEIDDKRKSGLVLHNIGYVLSQKKQYPEALDYYQQALKIREEYSDKGGIASTLLNISEIYQIQNKYPETFNYLSRAKALYEEIGNKYGILQIKIAMADYYLQINKPAKSIQTLEPILNTDEILAENLTQAYEILSKAYSKSGLFNQAYTYQGKYIKLKDSLENQENTKKILQIQLGYEFDKKQKELEIVREKQRLNDLNKLQSRKLVIFILIICLIAFLLIAILIYRSYRLKRRDNIILEQQKKEIQERNEELKLYQEELISQKEHLEDQKKLVILHRDKISEQNEKIRDSILYARRIQNSILPPEESFSEVFSDYFILYRPKDIVSGDFYWIKETGTHVYLAVADCTGHGVPGAFMSLLGISFLNEVTEGKLLDSAEILNKTRARLKTTLHQQINNTEPRDGMDIGLCVINKKTRELQFSGAYNSLLIIKNDNDQNTELIEYKGDKMPIGSHYKESNSFTTHKISTRPSDKFFLFTDGFVDQFGGLYNRKFLPNRFKEILLKTKNESMPSQKESLVLNLEKWMENSEQIDDILVVGFSF